MTDPILGEERRAEPAARPAGPPAAPGPGAVRAGRLRRHRRPGPQEAAAGRLRPGQPGAAADRLRAARLRPPRLGRRRLRGHGPRGRPASTPARRGGRRSGRGWPATSSSCPARSTTTTPSTRWPSTLDELRDAHGIKGNAAFYLSIPPAAFPVVLKQLQRTGMADNDKSGGWRRVVVEKPFGHDLESAPRAQRPRRRRVHRRRTCSGSTTTWARRRSRTSWRCASPTSCSSRCGTPTTSTRCRSRWPRTSASAPGPASTTPTGAARDVLQNHLLQLLALVGDGGADRASTRTRSATEKLKVLRAITLPDATSATDTIRGQYTQGWLAGERVAGYRQEKDVPPDSTTETYVAVRLGVETRRWAGVPFYLRTGKRLPRRVTEIAISSRRRRTCRSPRPTSRMLGQQPAGHPGAAGRGRDAEVRLEGARHARWRSATSRWTSCTARRSPSPARRRTSG